MKSIKKQAGSMLMSALFIAILMLGLGLALVNILSSSAHNNAVEYYGARAFLAAQSGIEQSLTQLFVLGAANTSQASTAACNSFPKTTPFTSQYLSGCTAVLSCIVTTSDLGSPATTTVPDLSSPSGEVTVYRLTSTATCSINNCTSGSCLKDTWQTQRSISVEAKTLN
ncbi:hypothetical protein [Pseudoalteromonas denitrificans]|uniref:MSHA biogenesis protein MshP n=1 Tax=Pseudoalteromonas denitrificans DSM 6059 TaxID=1123010 RepID=A0A1I1DR28_9GAMM|nr:hypothetical protein [Pseudoalteromonas denitrificans]SFB77435.1 MSHA biogenesis protein MshP [Pseudoalteromonas denitrificans DSM 6059]